MVNKVVLFVKNKFVYFFLVIYVKDRVGNFSLHVTEEIFWGTFFNSPKFQSNHFVPLLPTI